MKPIVVGLLGYGLVGKDTAAHQLRSLFPSGIWERVAFADPIKADLAPVLKRYSDYVPGFDANAPATKKLLRDLYEGHGTRVGRQLNNLIWIQAADKERVVDLLGRGINVIITDVRNYNEYEYVASKGGKTYCITRPDVGPATPLEGATISETIRRYPETAFIDNCGTAEELGVKLREQIFKDFPEMETAVWTACSVCGRHVIVTHKCRYCGKPACINCIQMYVAKTSLKRGLVCNRCK